MRQFRTQWRLAIFAIATALFAQAGGSTQAVVVQWQGPALGNWNTPANWQDGAIFGLPNALNDEAAGIGNNTTAVLSASASTNVAGLLLGQAAGTSGGLRIANGGNLGVISGISEMGAITVGSAGQGNLEILGGGTLSGASLTLGGSTASNLLLGDTSGLTASLSTSGNATLGRTTQITGRFVDFNVGGNVTLSSAGTLVGRINHASLHSPLKSAGTANVGGALRVEFSGVSPTVGSAWNIVDAATINGSFASLDMSAAPTLPAGQIYRLRRSTGGTNGQLLQLTIAQVLTLQVNRTNGAVSIANTGASPVTLDGYSIVSSLGALTGSWNSLTDQAVPGWVEADPMNTDLSELHREAGGLTLNGGQSRTLGTPYVPVFPAFGIDPDHLEFEYSTPDGEVFTGSVQYTGPKINNNLVINVNPTTGQAQLKNDSPYVVRIDGYSIYSPSNSLQPANGKWLSLQDRGVAGWEEAMPGSGAVSELNENGVLNLSPFSGYDLGELFKSSGGTQDLRAEFLMNGEDLPVDGVVAFGSFGAVGVPRLAGDFNSDGFVNAADYTVWRDHLGAANESALNGNGNGLGGIDIADFELWKSNFGASAGAGSGASQSISSTAQVPEPATIALLLVGTILCCSMRMNRWKNESSTSYWNSAMKIAFASKWSQLLSVQRINMPVASRRMIVALMLLGTFCIQHAAAQTVIFKDDFDGDTVPATAVTPVAETNVGAPWGVNAISPSTYQSTNNPFAAGNLYASVTDPGPSASPSQAVRLQSNAGADTSLESSLNAQVTTFSFDFFEPTRAGDVNSVIFGYYRQQANPDLNGAGRSYSSTLHDGTLAPQGPLLGGAATIYSLDTVHTLFMIANDSGSALSNYLGTGRTLADTSADVWISLAGADPTYAFSVDKQNAVAPNNTPLSGIGFRSFNADIEQFFIDNVLVTSSASFDRSTFAGPCADGDVNCDAVIDVANDFEAIRSNFRRTVGSRSLGDLSGDGLVSLRDFVEWKSAFLNGGGSLEGINLSFLSVPEPSTGLLAAAAATVWFGLRRRRPIARELNARILGLMAIGVFTACWANVASAQLKVYEGFDYPNSASIIGGSGGGGWSDNWTKTGNAASTELATSPGLTYQTLPATGEKVVLTGQQTAGAGNSSFVFRTFNSGFGADGTTAWLSFIGQRTGAKSGVDGAGDTPSYQRLFGISFFDAGTATTNERFNVGELSSTAAVDDLDRWSLNIFNPAGAGEVVASSTPIDQQSFLLVRIDFGTGTLADNGYLWVNPNLSAGEPSIATAQASLIGRNLQFDRLRLSAGGSLGTGEIAAASGTIDELRIGTSFSSVIGIGLIPGDVDGNGVANNNDYLVIRNHFHMSGAARADGDLSGDGLVNLVDFRLWKSNRTAGAGAEFDGDFLASVPEPSTSALAMLAAAALSMCRRSFASGIHSRGMNRN